MLYTWGPNVFGQLGHGDFDSRALPSKINNLKRKNITSVKLGNDFLISLGSNISKESKEKKRLLKESK